MVGRARCLVGLVVLASGCNEFGEFDVAVEPIELGVDVRLDAVTYDMYSDRFFAVGSGGLLVDELGNRTELPASLHDVIQVDGDARLIVVGADGFVGIAEPDGGPLEFEVEAVGTDADLWAVGGEGGTALRVVIVGDDVLIVGEEDEQGELLWTQPEAPPDGWGMLRAVDLEGRCAVGQAGRMVCMSEVEPDAWTVIELDTDANLNSFCAWYSMDVVGDDGTIVTRGNDGWEVVQMDPPVDMLACTMFWVHMLIVGADQTIYTVGVDGLEPLLELDWQPRALDPQLGMVLVGDNGRAAYLYQSEGIRLQ